MFVRFSTCWVSTYRSRDASLAVIGLIWGMAASKARLSRYSSTGVRSVGVGGDRALTTLVHSGDSPPNLK